MEDSLKSYIKTNALHGFAIFIGQNLPPITCPKIEEMGENLFPYLIMTNKFIELYEDEKEKMYFKIISSEESIGEFAIFLNFFIKYDNFEFNGDGFMFDDGNLISYENISTFMQIIKILHHRDKKDDDYKPSNKIAEEMMKRARKLKKELEEKMARKDGIGFLEISSAICARHPSINLLNINQLSYFQIIDQYKRLMSIDKYTPCLYGNATEEYINKNNVKHYVEKIENE